MPQSYFVGSDVGNADDAELKIIGAGLIEQLSHDDLPGITQLAAESALPHQKSENVSKREQFGLRPNLPYRPGVKKMPLGG